MKTYRLITYNIHKGVAPFRNLSVIDRVRISLVESKADFLLLQEVVGENSETPGKVLRHLEDLADEKWPHHAYGKNAVFPKRNHGNAILSSLPIQEFHNKDLTVYPIEMRGLLHVVLDWEGRKLHLCSVHLDLFEFTRKSQVKTVIEYLRAKVPADDPLILGGDFNDWAEKVGEQLEQALGLEEFSAPSFPAWHPILRLDRLYVRNVQVKHFRPLEAPPWDRLSDHLPLEIGFRPKKR